MQNWYRPHPYGVYPRGNATAPEDIIHRFGSLSLLITASTRDDKEHTEQPYIELMQYLFSFMEVPDLCRLARTCTGWYVMVHCTDAFRNAYTTLSPAYLRFYGSWKETAIRGYLRESRAADMKVPALGAKRARRDPAQPVALSHTPIMVRRPYFCDQLFQSWMCTILPSYYHMRQVPRPPSHTAAPSSSREGLHSDREGSPSTDAAHPNSSAGPPPPTQYTSAFKQVQRCSRLSPDEFRTRFERPNIPAVLTDIATEWPMYKILNGDFRNLANKKEELVRPGCSLDAPMRCEYTNMSLDDYVRYAMEQRDERPVYMFDAELASVLDVEKLYPVPEHFARDDFFSVLGDKRPKFRWLLAGPARGGSGFHVDPNYTNAWNANLTGRKRWLLFPPFATPPGVVPSANMAEVATPISLTEWLLNYYDTTVEQLSKVGYECICEAGDIMFVPSGWWHSVVNLEDSVAITHNYVSECNLPNVVKFLRAMKSSISGVNEDADGMTEEEIVRRQQGFADEFCQAMAKTHPGLMQRIEEQLEDERVEREKRRVGHLTKLEAGSEGFKFDF